jgi:hypothetical protein
VTDRMLQMFRRRPAPERVPNADPSDPASGPRP